MKVLHVLSTMEFGGGPQHVLTLANGLRALGIESVVAAPEGPMRTAFLDAGIPVVPWSAAGRAGHDLVHSHGKAAGLYGRWMAWVQRMPAVHTFHGLHYEGYGPVKRQLYFALERMLAWRTAAIIHLTDAQRAEAAHVGLPGGHVIPNGIDAAGVVAAAYSRDEARRRLDVPPHAYVMGTIARHDPVKRIDALVAAHAELPADIHLVIIGGVGEVPLRLVRRGRAAGVHFIAGCPGAARYLRAFDVFVTASSREGLPLALLEAMAVGLPVVASDIPAHRVVLGSTTQVSDDLERMVSWLRGNPTVAADLGVRNQRTVVAFSAETMAEQTAVVYLRATGRWSEMEVGPMKGFRWTGPHSVEFDYRQAPAKGWDVSLASWALPGWPHGLFEHRHFGAVVHEGDRIPTKDELLAKWNIEGPGYRL